MKKKSFVALFLLFFLFLTCFNNEPIVKKGKENIQLRKICNLPLEIFETSGIIFYKGLVWSFNDSGNLPVLYGLDTIDCSVKYRITLDGIENIDWETIGQDENFIYIGDIGNNNTTRTNFQFYKINKDSIKFTQNQVLKNFSTIEFTFSEENEELLEEFDSEAMLVSNDSIILYTKDWKNYETTAIYLANKEGNTEAKVFGTFDIEGLVTAIVQSDDGKIYILGYADYIPFVQILDSDILLQDVKESKRYDLTLYQGMQSEAITFENGQYFISCEGSYIEQGLYEIIFN